MIRFSHALLCAAFISLGPLAPAAEATAASATSATITYTPSPENLAAREWFQDARFGMFIHWGVYSMMADKEWVMHNKQIHAEDYEHLARGFYPADFDAAEWVSLAKAAGMKYITFTSRHHDGFSMWDTAQSDWDIVDRTPYKRDIVKQLADECHKQGLKLFFYYSHLDWNHPDYFPRGKTGQHAGRPESGDWHRYLDFVDAQLTELLTNYGEIGGIWFDGHWDKPDADWRLDRTYGLIHKLQPAALIGNNHHLAPIPGEDFQMYEKDLPGQNKSGFSATSTVGDLPLETCDTMNDSWGFTVADRNWKSTRDLVHYLTRAAGYNGNFLLNVGPMPNGEIPPESVERLREIGEWMEKYGETIYGSRGGPIAPQPWGVTTQKDDRVYVHVLDDSVTSVTLKPPKAISSARAFDGGAVVKTTAEGEQVKIELPEPTAGSHSRIIILE
jgi:alpha-L-fucosidase